MQENEIAEKLAEINAAPAVELWSCNVRTAEIFASCVGDWAVDVMPSGSRIWRGIPSESIRAAIELAGIDRELWPEVSFDLRHMALAAAKVLNEPSR